ncbi:MAG: PHP domain-containing protein [Patescibacteria group bacterium]
MNSHFTDEYANWAYDQENRYGGPLGPYRAVDLHCHTICSDGIDSVEELVHKARARKLEFVAVTDHDYVNKTATQLLKANGIESCEAAEISARDYENKHSLHITFYAKHISDRTIKILDSVRT